MDKVKVLFLAADPSDSARLRLGQELRDIRDNLQRSRQRDSFLLESRESVRPGDITQAIFDVEPQIVHFSGHGMSTGELCFEDIQGKIKTVTPDALANLFKLVSKQVCCIILNACYSELQAEAIAKHIPYVIGMNQAIGDGAAIAFAVGFYKALGAGRSIEEAYEFARVEIQLEGIPEHLTPVLKSTHNLNGDKLQGDVAEPERWRLAQTQQRVEAQRKTQEQPNAEHKRQRAKAEYKRQAEADLQKQVDAADQDDLSSERFGSNYYAKLRDLLAAQDWRSADQETLDRMREVMSRQNEGWLRIEDIKKFPCLDLANIDRLWVKYSKGKFGFSVQRDIWWDCDHPAEYEMAWNKFTVTVGWRTRGVLGVGSKWLKHSELTFDFTAPKGHLPSERVGSCRHWLDGNSRHSLFSRYSDCRP